MKYDLYIDVFFLLNLFMDLLLLLSVKTIFRCSATHLRIILGAVFGAVMICIITVLPGIAIWIKLLIGYGIVSICMVRITFCDLTGKKTITGAICLYGMAFFFGGMLQFACQFSVFREHGIGLLGIMTVSFCGYATFSYIYKKISGKKRSIFYDVWLYNQTRKIKVIALADTGNSLTDPFSGKPVSVIGREVWQSLQGAEEKCSNERIVDCKTKPIDNFEFGSRDDFCVKPNGYRLIPYHSIGKSHGLLEGYQIDYMVIENKQEKWKVEKPIIAIANESLSRTETTYQMILHHSLIDYRRESNDFQSGNTGKISASTGAKGTELSNT